VEVLAEHVARLEAAEAARAARLRRLKGSLAVAMAERDAAGEEAAIALAAAAAAAAEAHLAAAVRDGASATAQEARGARDEAKLAAAAAVGPGVVTAPRLVADYRRAAARLDQLRGEAAGLTARLEALTRQAP
jgi:hypothetical protein